jgi:methylglutaconyl-CoA hydratase
MSDDVGVRFERRGQAGEIAWVILDRPGAKNALSRAVNTRLLELARSFIADASVRAVVITGTGDTFCAGADLKERRGVAAADSHPYINAIAGAINAIGEQRCPTVALMNGSAYGGGLELALACDFRILALGAELGLTEVRLGIMPGAGGTVRLPRLIGEARAKELILLGRRITAQRALEIGLVNQLVARDQLAAAGEALLAELAACAPLSVLHAKASIETGYGKSIAEANQIERENYDVTLFSEDRNEGLAAFAEKRKPAYRGR